MISRDERAECTARPLERLERLERNERIDRKSRLLEHLDPKREAELEDTFTIHLAQAVSASGPKERQQAVDKGTEAYEDALDGALYELLDKRFAEEDSGLSMAVSPDWAAPGGNLSGNGRSVGGVNADNGSYTSTGGGEINSPNLGYGACE